jgi:hypothetical protein
MNRRWMGILLTAAVLLLTGCSRFVDLDQPQVHPGAEVTLGPGHTLGQTLVARHGGLCGAEFWISPDRAGPGEIRLHIRSDPADWNNPYAGRDLATAVLPLAQVAVPGFHRLSFPPIRDSHGHSYYAVLELVGDGEVHIGTAEGGTYPDGALYRDHQPQDAQMAFRLVYKPAWVLLDLSRAAAGAVGLLAIAALLYVVPGWALLAWLCPRPAPSMVEQTQVSRAEALGITNSLPASSVLPPASFLLPPGSCPLSWAETLGIAAGLSLALYPLLLVWTDVVGLHLGPLYAWLPAVGGLVALVWRYRVWIPSRPRGHRTARHCVTCLSTNGLRQALRQWARSGHGNRASTWPDLALLAVMGLIFGVRLLIVRTLDAPMWGDSYQHSLIAQLMVDQGGLFDSWEPYTPYQTLTTHFGFSSLVALLSWFTGVSTVQATLLVGQLVNGLAILTLYPLAVRIADGRRWAGVGAVLVAGLLSPMPAYYVNWGRYAQLSGQAILPVALWLLWETLRRDTHSWTLSLLAGATLSGMALAYYRMPFYYVLFVLAWLICVELPRWGTDARRWLVGCARLALIAGSALLLLVPWGLRIVSGSLAQALEAGIRLSSPLNLVLADYQIWRDVAFYVPLPALAIAVIALVWSLARRRGAAASLGLWVLALASLVAGRLIHLPGANMMQNFAVLIALYIPVSLLAGWLVGEVASLVKRWAGRIGQCAIGTLIVVTAVWAAAGQAKIVQPSYVMVTRPDVRAMAWIRENTPPESRFLVEGFRIYDGYSAVGADAGWWIPLLAERENVLPPQYALLNEVPIDVGYTQRVVDLVAHLETNSPASPEGLQTLCDWGITHVYVGQGQGQVGSGATQLFSPDILAISPAFTTVYRQDRVHIFRLDPSVCGKQDVGARFPRPKQGAGEP